MESQAHGGTILCAVHPEDGPGAAVQLAQALQARLRMRLILVHVLASPRYGANREDEAPDAGARGAMAALVAQISALGGRVEVRIEAGARAVTIARVAGEEGADLIVVGARHGRRRTLRCELATELQTTTPVPVLVAPPATRKPSGTRLALGLGT